MRAVGIALSIIVVALASAVIRDLASSDDSVE
jgi:hypothetical protein